MPWPRTRALVILAASAGLLAGCASNVPTTALATSPDVTRFTQTEYSAVASYAKDGWVAGYEANLSGLPVRGSAFITRTAGAQWMRASTGSTIVTDLAFGSAAIGVAAGASPTSGSDVLYTADGGRRWHPSLALRQDVLRVGFFDARDGYLATARAIRFTADGGRTWHEEALPMQGVSDVVFASRDSGWAIAAKGIYATTDGGQRWHLKFSAPASLVASGVSTGQLAMRGSEAGWALLRAQSCSGSGCETMIVRTTDGGGHWQETALLPTAEATSTTPQGTAPQLLSAPQGGLLWNGPSGLWQSAGGVTWRQIHPAQQPGATYTAIAVGAQGSAWLIGKGFFGSYVLTSASGGPWQQVRPAPFPVAAVDFVSAQRGYGIGTETDPDAILGTVDGGQHWQVLRDSPRGLPVSISFTSPLHGAVTIEGNRERLLETSDGGKTWTFAGTLPAPAESLSLAAGGRGVAVTETGGGWPFTYGIFVTADGGRTWSAGAAVPQKLMPPPLHSPQTSPALVVAAIGDPGVQYLFSLDNRLPLLWSLSPGGRFLPLSVPAAATDAPQHYVGGGISVPSADDVWLALQPAATGGPVRVLRSANGGQTFASLQLPAGISLDAQFGEGQLVSAIDNRHAWLLTNVGVLETKDGGNSWSMTR